MIVLGIDPGLAEMGWAAVEGNGRKPGLIEHGCFKTEKTAIFSSRLSKLGRQIRALIRKFHPNELAIEELFFAKNAKTAIKIAQCIGAIKLSADQLGVKVYEYTPLNVKMTMTGFGRAEKSQVQKMVTRLLGLSKKITSDHAADAAAVALTHIFTNKRLKE